jgi:predicted RNase H-like nuclease (RuvC/YqgF family)
MTKYNKQHTLLIKRLQKHLSSINKSIALTHTEDVSVSDNNVRIEKLENARDETIEKIDKLKALYT